MQRSEGFQGRAVRRLAAVAMAVAMAVPAMAQQQAPKNYGAIHAGQNNLSSWPADVNFGAANASGSLKLARDLHFGLMAGRQSGDYRLEVEYQRGRIDIDSVSVGAVTQAAGARGSYQALTFNAYRTFELASQWNAFVGLGIGWGRVSMPGLGAISGCNCFVATSDNGWAWQARLGAEYELTPDSQLFAQYTYLRLPNSASGTVPGVSYASRRVSAISVGYKAGF